MATIAPPLVAARAAPYTAMEIRMYADTLPAPSPLGVLRARAEDQEEQPGKTRVKMIVRRLRSIRASSSRAGWC